MRWTGTNVSGGGGELLDTGVAGAGAGTGAGGGVMMTAPPEGGKGDGMGVVAGNRGSVATWPGSPRLAVIRGRKNPSMASVAQGWSGPHAGAGAIFNMPNNSPVTPAQTRRRRSALLPEKTILSGSHALVNQRRGAASHSGDDCVPDLAADADQFPEMRWVSLISIRLLRRRASSVPVLSSG